MLHNNPRISYDFGFWAMRGELNLGRQRQKSTASNMVRCPINLRERHFVPRKILLPTDREHFSMSNVLQVLKENAQTKSEHKCIRINGK